MGTPSIIEKKGVFKMATRYTEEFREEAVQVVLESKSSLAEVAEYLGAKWVVTHLGSCGFPNSEVERKRSRLDCVIRSVQDICARTSGLSVKLALENLPRYPETRAQCRLGDCAEEFRYVLDRVPADRAGVVFDVAHARINVEPTRNAIEFATAVSDRILGLHVHWNDGRSDSHSPLSLEALDELDGYVSCLQSLCNRDIPMIIECYQLQESLDAAQLLSRLGGG